MKELHFYSVKEVAELLKVTRHAVYSWIEGGKLKAHKFTERRTRISSEDLDRFMKDSIQHNPTQENASPPSCNCP
jgi:excisionase family DNA binding protein